MDIQQRFNTTTFNGLASQRGSRYYQNFSRLSAPTGDVAVFGAKKKKTTEEKITAEISGLLALKDKDSKKLEVWYVDMPAADLSHLHYKLGRLRSAQRLQDMVEQKLLLITDPDNEVTLGETKLSQLANTSDKVTYLAHPLLALAGLMGGNTTDEINLSALDNRMPQVQKALMESDYNLVNPLLDSVLEKNESSETIINILANAFQPSDGYEVVVNKKDKTIALKALEKTKPLNEKPFNKAEQLKQEVAQFKNKDFQQKHFIQAKVYQLRPLYEVLLNQDAKQAKAFMNNVLDHQQIVLEDEEDDTALRTNAGTLMKGGRQIKAPINPILLMGVLSIHPNAGSADVGAESVDLSSLDADSPLLVDALIRKDSVQLQEFADEFKAQGMTAVADTLSAIALMNDVYHVVSNPPRFLGRSDTVEVKIGSGLDAQFVSPKKVLKDRLALKGEVETLLTANNKKDYFEKPSKELLKSAHKRVFNSNDQQSAAALWPLVESNDVLNEGTEALSDTTTFEQLAGSGDLNSVTMNPLFLRLLAAASGKEGSGFSSYEAIEGENDFTQVNELFHAPTAAGLNNLKKVMAPKTGSVEDILLNKAIKNAEALEATEPGSEPAETPKKRNFFQRCWDGVKNTFKDLGGAIKRKPVQWAVFLGAVALSFISVAAAPIGIFLVLAHGFGWLDKFLGIGNYAPAEQG